MTTEQEHKFDREILTKKSDYISPCHNCKLNTNELRKFTDQPIYSHFCSNECLWLQTDITTITA